MNDRTRETLKRLLATIAWVAIVALAWRAHSTKVMIIATLVYAMIVSPAFAKAWGNAVSRIVLTILYVLMLPFGMGVRLFSDPLKVKKVPADSFWEDRDAADDSLEKARSQG
jgi:hypothetical protein